MTTLITPEEEANGWTQLTLDKYRRSRNRQQALKILRPKPIAKPNEQNHSYNPFRWRK